MYRRIVVPYDGSEPSRNALKHAVKLAQSVVNGPEVTVLHVVEKILLPPSLSHEMIRSPKSGELIDRDTVLKEEYHNLRQRDHTMLQDDIETLKSGHVTFRSKVMYGSPAECVIDFAKDYKADLIVIGNIGLSGIAKLKVLGSVSRSVSERAPCPVLIIH